MPSLNDLTEKDLLLPAVFEKTKRAFLECQERALIPESHRFADLLDKKIGITLQTTNPELYREYQEIIICLKFISLSLLDKKTLLSLVENHALDAFKNSIDLNERMTSRMYAIPELAWEDEQQEILEALKENTQKLGSQTITLKGDTVPVNPLVNNWLADYDRTFGPEKQDNIKQQQYFTQNPNAKLLKEEDKKLLVQLIKFYDNLKPLPIATIDSYLRAAGINPEEIGGAQGAESKEVPVFASPTEAARMKLEGQNISTQELQQARQGDTYREAVEEKDFTPHPPQTAPKPPSPPTAPIVNLKDLGNKP
jgi:hypothetical protein